jgi:hypothetical protein
MCPAQGVLQQHGCTYPAQGVLQQHGCTQPKVCYSSRDVPSPRCATVAWMYPAQGVLQQHGCTGMYPAQGVLQQCGCTQPKVCYSSRDVPSPRCATAAWNAMSPTLGCALGWTVGIAWVLGALQVLHTYTTYACAHTSRKHVCAGTLSQGITERNIYNQTLSR